jgi:hypothetical protein
MLGRIRTSQQLGVAWLAGSALGNRSIGRQVRRIGKGTRQWPCLGIMPCTASGTPSLAGASSPLWQTRPTARDAASAVFALLLALAKQVRAKDTEPFIGLRFRSLRLAPWTRRSSRRLCMLHAPSQMHLLRDAQHRLCRLARACNLAA